MPERNLRRAAGMHGGRSSRRSEGPAFWRMLLSGRPLDDGFVTAVTEQVVDGVRARAG
jgi:hypothetical protein